MAEELDRSSPDRQAIWVALKTLRQRPTVVGRTDDGATVYEIRSVRLVLPAGAVHFKRLVTCAKCGRRVPGSVVMGPADLDRPATPVFCDRCGRAVDRPSREASPETREVPAPAPPRAAEPVVTPSAVDDGRLAAVEAQLAELLSREPAPDGSAGALRRLSDQVAAHLRGQSAEMAKMAASVAEVRAEMRELVESNRAIDHARGELEQRMVELAARVAALPVADPEAVTARDLADLRAGVTDMIDARAQAVHAALREGLDHLGGEVAAHSHADIEESLARELVEVGTSLAAALTQGLDHFRSELASLQQRVDEAAAGAQSEQAAEANGGLAEAQRELDQKVSDLAAHVAAMAPPDPEAVGGRELAELRAELTEALHDVAQETLMAVAEPLRDLTKAREEFERRVEALHASARAAASRLHALEQKVQRPAQKRRPPKALVDSLERQLREAEERLSQL